MQQNKIDENQLIVSWNRYEQGLMKQHLMKCLGDDIYCFGDQKEVQELYTSLVRHGALRPGNNNQTNFQQLVSEIKTAIQDNLKQYNGKTFPGAQWYSINNDAETQFLTRFAMAIQDTKKRDTFFPGGCTVDAGNQTNQNCYKIYFDHNNPNYYITLAKVKLFSLATQLTRIGLNCKTTIHSSDRIKAPANLYEISKPNNIHLIDTNNFLDFYRKKPFIGPIIDMDKLGIGMDGVQYYKNLYRKLFDFALQKEKQDGEYKGIWKIPEFVIPLGGAWGSDLNYYIFQALNDVLEEKWKRPSNIKGQGYAGKYKQFISVKIIDGGQWHNYAKQNYQNLHNIGIVNYTKKQQLFNDERKEHYMIMAGDHFAFLGNEAMKNGINGDTTSVFRQGGKYNDSSLESANMKTDFFKFYGQGPGQQTGWANPSQCGFHQNNGAWIMNPYKLGMPQRYLLHCNYQGDALYQMDGNQQLQQNYNSKPIIMSHPAIFKNNNFKYNNFARRF